MRMRSWGVAVLLSSSLWVGAEAQEISEALENSYPTNLNMLTEAANAAVSEMFLNFSLPPGSSLLLEAEADHEAQWFVQTLLLDRLSDAGYVAYLKHVDPPVEPANRPKGKGEEGEESSDGAEIQTDDPPTGSPGDAGADPGPPRTLSDSVKETAKIGDGPGSGSMVIARENPETDYILRFRVAECAVTYPHSYKKSPLGGRTVQRLASVNLFATLLTGKEESVAWVGRGDAERLDLVPAGKLSLLEGKTFPFSRPVLNTRGYGAIVEPALVTGIVLGLVYLFYTNQN